MSRQEHKETVKTHCFFYEKRIISFPKKEETRKKEIAWRKKKKITENAETQLTKREGCDIINKPSRDEPPKAKKAGTKKSSKKKKKCLTKSARCDRIIELSQRQRATDLEN